MISPFRIFCWSPTTTRFCRPMTVPGNIPVEQIAARVSRTPGERVLCIQGCGDEIVQDPNTLAPVADFGIWFNGATMAAAARIYQRFHQLKVLGVELDAYFANGEKCPNTWNMTPARLAAMLADPRWAATGGPALTGWPAPDQILTVNNYLAGQWTLLMNSTLVDAIHRNYAGIPIGNAANQAGDGSMTDINGQPAYAGYRPLGNRQCVEYYGQLNWPGATPEDAYRYGIDLLLMARRCSRDPVTPWVPTNSYAGLLRDTPFYRRYILAALTICGPNLLCWPGDVAGSPDMTLLDSIAAEAQGAISTP